MKSNISSVQRLTLLGLFSAFAIILGYVEFLLPVNIPIYGFKLGLANLSTLLVLYLFNVRWAFFVSVIRISIINVLFGTFFSFCFSIAAGIASLLVMSVFCKIFKYSMMFSSAIGGLVHNIVQLVVASVILGSDKIFYLLWVLSVVGIITGILIGFLGFIIYSKIHVYVASIERKS